MQRLCCSRPRFNVQWPPTHLQSAAHVPVGLDAARLQHLGPLGGEAGPAGPLPPGLGLGGVGEGAGRGHGAAEAVTPNLRGRCRGHVRSIGHTAAHWETVTGFLQNNQIRQYYATVDCRRFEDIFQRETQTKSISTSRKAVYDNNVILDVLLRLNASGETFYQ